MNNNPSIPRPPHRLIWLRRTAYALLIASVLAVFVPVACAFMFTVFFFGAHAGAPELKLIDYAVEAARVGVFVAPIGCLISAIMLLVVRRSSGVR